MDHRRQPAEWRPRAGLRRGASAGTLAVVLGLSTVVLLGGSVHAQSSEPGSRKESVPAAAQAEESRDQESVGRQYTIVAIQKGKEGVHFIRLDDRRVQVRHGVQLEVEREDDEYFYVRRYAPVAQSLKGADQSTEIETAGQPLADDGAADQTESRHLVSDVAVLPQVDRLRVQPFDRGLPRRGQWRNGFDLADLDSDGDVDLLFGSARKAGTPPNLFLSDGAGNWRRWSGRFPEVTYDYGDAVTADFNRDGHLDIALAVHLSGVLVMVSDGRGGYRRWSQGLDFEPPQGGRPSGVFSTRAIQAADWDGDGWPDLLALGEGPQGLSQSVASGGKLLQSLGLRVFLNQQDGTWVAVTRESNIFGDSLAVGDLNGDGRLDAVTSSRSQGGAGLLHIQTPDGAWSIEPLRTGEGRRAPHRRPGAFVFSVAVADLDSDGRDDVLVGYVQETAGASRTALDAFFREPSAAHADWSRVPLFEDHSRVGVYSIAVGDLDKNQSPDVAFGTGDGRVHLLLADSDLLAESDNRQFLNELEPAMQQQAPGCAVYGLAVADVTGDGRNEVVASFAGEPQGLDGHLRVPGCVGEGSVRVWRAVRLADVD